MKLVKSLLLGSAAALVAGAGAQAADLPARKAAPVEYVKVCDAYGAGFFFIPGTDTCIKVGGRVRADFAMSSRETTYTGGTINGTAGTITVGGVTTPVLPAGTRNNTIGVVGGSENIYGWEARGRVDLDARTQTPYGTVQAVASIRLARTTGILNATGPGISASSASPTLEAAYVRFAGFTFGAARDNFAFMPSTFYGSGHWASFANGAKQIAYTAVLGGGFSATIAIQDASDTTGGARNVSAFSVFNPVAGTYTQFATGVFGPPAANVTSGLYAYNQMPQINGRLDWDQGWGSASIMGAVGRVNQNSANGYISGGTTTLIPGLGDASADQTVWAIGAGVKVNLPMIAAGDVLWLNAAYANGMTEYTVNWSYVKTSDTSRNAGGFVYNNAPSWVNYVDVNGNAQIQTLKSWNLAAVYTHYWTPEWRHSFLATGGRIEGSGISNAATFANGGFGDVTVWNVGTQLAWLPTRNFEIGVDILYNRVSQNVGRSVTNAAAVGAPGFGVANQVVQTRESTNGVTGRLRVERTF
jgi:hypothetical protein